MRIQHESTVDIEGGEALRRALWGSDYKEKEARSIYLLGLIAQQQAEASARNALPTT